jgi:hypothetical protein
MSGNEETLMALKPFLVLFPHYAALLGFED